MAIGVERHPGEAHPRGRRERGHLSAVRGLRGAELGLHGPGQVQGQDRIERGVGDLVG